MSACLLVGAAYKPGDPAPDGYLAWHEWAEVQYAAGLRQKPCGRCGKWRYPQELSPKVEKRRARDKYGQPTTYDSYMCLNCATPTPHDAAESETV